MFENYKDYPQITITDIKIKYHSNFWDGYLSGVIEYNGNRYWFENCDEYFDTPEGLEYNKRYNEAEDANIEFTEKEPWYRRFAILELTEEEWVEEDYWHNLFREKVGTHTDYDDVIQKRKVGALQPQNLWAEYYEAAKSRKPRVMSSKIPIGWFEK